MLLSKLLQYLLWVVHACIWIQPPQVSDIMATRALLIWSPPVSDPGDSRFEVMKPILPEDLAYEVKLR